MKKEIAITMMLFMALVGCVGLVKAETVSDKISEQKFSYINEAPVLKPDAVNFLLMETPKAQPISEESSVKKQSQCFAAGRTLVHCMH